jgi:hypothetical protein
VQGVPFPDAFALEAWRVPWTAGTQRILLGHCFAAPARGDYFGEPVHSYAELLDVSQADYIVLGHDHTHRGIFRFDESGQARYVLDVGAMARLALSDSDTSRVPMFSVIDTGARSVTPYSFHSGRRPPSSTWTRRRLSKRRLPSSPRLLTAEGRLVGAAERVDRRGQARGAQPFGRGARPRAGLHRAGRAGPTGAEG